MLIEITNAKPDPLTGLYYDQAGLPLRNYDFEEWMNQLFPDKKQVDKKKIRISLKYESYATIFWDKGLCRGNLEFSREKLCTDLYFKIMHSNRWECSSCKNYTIKNYTIGEQLASSIIDIRVTPYPYEDEEDTSFIVAFQNVAWELYIELKRIFGKSPTYWLPKE